MPAKGWYGHYNKARNGGEGCGQFEPLDAEPGLAVVSYRDETSQPMRYSICQGADCNAKATIGTTMRQENGRWRTVNYCDKCAQDWWNRRVNASYSDRDYQCYPLRKEAS